MRTKKTRLLLILAAFVLSLCVPKGSGAASEPVITAWELMAMIDSGFPVTVIDVRSTVEYDYGHIPGSVSIHSIRDIANFHNEGKVVLYSTSRQRSEKVLKMFAGKGIEAVDLEGGINSWTGLGGNVVEGPYKGLSDYPDTFEVPKGVCETKEPVMKVGK